MGVLVDTTDWPGYGRWWCHLVSDVSYAELHVFAAGAGLPRRAFHRDHYDVPAGRRAELVAAGAELVSSRELVHRLRRAGLRRRAPRPPAPG